MKRRGSHRSKTGDLKPCTYRIRVRCLASAIQQYRWTYYNTGTPSTLVLSLNAASIRCRRLGNEATNRPLNSCCSVNSSERDLSCRVLGLTIRVLVWRRYSPLHRKTAAGDIKSYKKQIMQMIQPWCKWEKIKETTFLHCTQCRVL